MKMPESLYQLSAEYSRLNASRTSLWFVQDAPIYCLNTELLRAFEQSDVEQNSRLLADLRPPLPTFILLFPQNSITTPEGGVLDYCVVHLSDMDHPEYSILVSGAAGGVGSLVAQLVLRTGASVVGTAGSSHHDWLRSLGAHPINYENDLQQSLGHVAPGGFDAVIDTVNCQKSRYTS